MAKESSGNGRTQRAGPVPVAITATEVAAIAARYGLPNRGFEPIESIGIINSVYALGDRFVLRVPRDDAGHVAQAHREACAIPGAVAAGVRTPRLVAFDDSLEILPVPFLVVERVDGENAESLGVVPPDPRAAWRRLGADLARLHSSGEPPPAGEPWPDEQRDPRHLVELRAEDGWISSLEARRLQSWLDRLAPLVVAVPAVFVHGDLQMSNVILEPRTGGYVAVLDWGGARRGNPADDFSVVPLAAVAPMLEGYRDVATEAPGVTEASILWRRVQLVLQLLPRGAAPGWAWGERPLAWLVDLLLHFGGATRSPWRELAP